MIPTAEEFLDNSDFPVDKTEVWDLDIHDIMIKFAKLHVEAALKEASENVIIDGHPFEYELDKNSIINAYPLENIK